MFSSFMKQMNEAVESAGGVEAMASQGMGMAKSFLSTNDPSRGAPRNVDDSPQSERWGSINLNGNKKSVLIGINYVGQQGELRGCINDVKMMKQFLKDENAFPDDADHMLVLTEDEPQHNHPNKARILEAMHWLVDSAQEGDTLFFHYSGHGTRVPDKNGDEEDGYDEALCPLDFKTQSMIIDDVVNQILISKVPHGVRLTVIMDCCHSGSICDLPYVFKATEESMVNWREDLPSMFMNHRWDTHNFNTLLKSGTEFGKQLYDKFQASRNAPEVDSEAKFFREGTKAAMGEIVMFSGCKDCQTSADVSDTSSFDLPTDCGPGGAGGACTNAFISVLHAKDKPTYVELLDSMRTILKEKKFSQVPCLSSSRAVPLDMQFDLGASDAVSGA